MIVLPSHRDGMAFLPLASCLAVWTKEPRFASFDARLIKEMGFNPLKWIECLRSQAAVSKATISQGRRLTPLEKYLVDVAEDGLIDALVIWEIAVAQDAAWSLRAPPELRAAMARYLQKYVFEPIPSGGR